MDPRLRAAVDNSLAWYDDVFALHAIPTKVDAGVWWALRPPPPWHSAVKTTRPGVRVDHVLAIHESGAVADSFGDLDLAPHGFTLLVDATWVHHPPSNELRYTLPTGWSLVRDPELLAEWNRAHDYEGVLVSAVLERPEFMVLARHVGGALVAGAVFHRGGRPDLVGLSNAWSATSVEVDYSELLAVAAALHPGSSITDFAQEADVGAMVAAGFAPVGPQRVWVREPG